MEKQKLIDLMYGLTERVGLVDFYLEESQNLQKKDSTLRICDLDDTLFCRQDQLEAEELLRKNRGGAGNTIIANTLGLHNYAKKYYHSEFPKDIFEKLDKNTDLILTAGMPELQHMKARHMGIVDDYTVRVVAEGQDKILESIRYVLFELKYIPSEIIVYEDRTKYFEQYRPLIEGVLGTKLIIMYVEMDGNDGYIKIQEV